jgi:glutathione S-transferase
MTLPRPEITDALGIKYRRIPILAIGNDVYCDTSLIADVLERRFPASEGYGTLFPHRAGSKKADTGLAKALTVYWNDKTVFPLGGNSLPYEKFDPAFVADRSQVRCSTRRQSEKGSF